ncbi:hypothetical protein D3C81_982980 [compost metagenome]
MFFRSRGQVQVAAGDLRRRRGDGLRAAAHLADDVHQAGIHVFQRLQQLARFFRRVHLDLAGQVARGHRLRHFHGRIDRLRDGPRDVGGAGDADGRRQQRQDHHQAFRAHHGRAARLHAGLGHAVIELDDLVQARFGFAEQRARILVLLVEVHEQRFLALLVAVVGQLAQDGAHFVVVRLPGRPLALEALPQHGFRRGLRQRLVQLAPRLDIGPGARAQLQRFGKFVLCLVIVFIDGRRQGRGGDGRLAFIHHQQALDRRQAHHANFIDGVAHGGDARIAADADHQQGRHHHGNEGRQLPFDQ